MAHHGQINFLITRKGTAVSIPKSMPRVFEYATALLMA
jgi:hypothetical protein